MRQVAPAAPVHTTAAFWAARGGGVGGGHPRVMSECVCVSEWVCVFVFGTERLKRWCQQAPSHRITHPGGNVLPFLLFASKCQAAPATLVERTA